MFRFPTLDVLTLPPNMIVLELQELRRDNNTDNNDDYEVNTGEEFGNVDDEHDSDKSRMS